MATMTLENKKDSYARCYENIRATKLAQTAEKTRRNGFTDEDDYNTRPAPDGFVWENDSNHPDGMFYGFDGCSRNFAKLLRIQPPYVDKNSSMAGGMYYFLGRLRTGMNEDGGWNPDYSYAHLQPDFDTYDIYPGIGALQHMCGDIHIGFELGWGGLLEKVRHYAKQHVGDAEKETFYAAHERTILGIQAWIQNTIREIDRQLAAENDPFYRDNLQKMKATNEWVVSGAPRTLREACQFYAWYNLAGRIYNRDGAAGQIDEFLRPYYERDKAAGLIDDADAVFFIAGMLDTRYYQLGGPGPDGKDMTSPLSFLVLEACEKLDVATNVTIRVHDGLDPALLRKGVECLFKYKNGWPRFSGDKALTEGFVKNGYPIELARERIAVGCNWMAIPGREYAMNDQIKINLAKCLEVALEEFFAKEGDKNASLLFDIYQRHVDLAVDIVARGVDFHLTYQKHNFPELVINLMCDGPIEKGLDVSDGGVEFYNIGVDASGIAVVADSIGALGQRVDEEGRCTYEEVYKHLKTNFAGTDGERMRLLLSTAKRFGYGGSHADKWANRAALAFADAVTKKPTPEKRVKMVPGLFSWSYTLRLGKTVGATPNGRRAGEPINHGANPLPGFRSDGALTALSTAIANVQCGYGNTSPFQLELDPGVAKLEDGIQRVEQLIRSHFELGGTLININIVDAEKIRAAHQDPSAFPDLVVRVTGFTAYFSTLSPGFRQLVVDRLLVE